MNIVLVMIIIEFNGTYRNWPDNEGMFALCGLDSILPAIIIRLLPIISLISSANIALIAHRSPADEISQKQQS